MTAVLWTVAFFLASCGTTDTIQETPIAVADPRQGGEGPPAGSGQNAVSRPAGSGIAEELRSLTESGVLSSMRRAMEFIRSRNLDGSEFGRVMNGVNIALLRRIYPDEAAGIPAPDIPQAHVYARILRAAEQGNYTSPPVGSTDYLEHVLPFLALYDETRPERLLAALPDLQKARTLREDSALAPFFMGLVYERSGRPAEAKAAFTRALDVSGECYPAAIALARMAQMEGRVQEALRILLKLADTLPGNMAVKRQLAIAWYDAGDWQRAEPAIAEILRQNSRDGKFILMRAHILLEQKQYVQAQAALDLYASFNPASRLYLFLRARIQAEGFHNREQALSSFRALLRSFPGDEDAAVYTARLLMESSNAVEQAEGRELFQRLLGSGKPSPAALALGLQDAVNRENWLEAQNFLNRLPGGRRSSRDLYNAYLAERGLGNVSSALAYARELYERDTTNDDGITAYISALLDTGRQAEAGKMIDARLAALSGGVEKSRYYYLRSRVRSGEEAVLADLRSSLFEDPRNLSALIALFEIYHLRKDERRAVYYLKQALAIAPDNPRLRRYESEYAGLLNAAP